MKAVVQTGERPDFERTTSSGIPARPGPITSGMPKPRLDFRVSSGFLDASALSNDSQVGRLAKQYAPLWQASLSVNHCAYMVIAFASVSAPFPVLQTLYKKSGKRESHLQPNSMAWCLVLHPDML